MNSTHLNFMWPRHFSPSLFKSRWLTYVLLWLAVLSKHFFHTFSFKMMLRLSVLLTALCLPCKLLHFLTQHVEIISLNVPACIYNFTDLFLFLFYFWQVWMVRLWSLFPPLQCWKSLRKLSVFPVEEVVSVLAALEWTGSDNLLEKH